ncbi:MAG: hypothetical protein AB8V22_09845 [Arsenophonus endosymbiont of Dermacentor nuttalli]
MHKFVQKYPKAVVVKVRTRFISCYYYIIKTANQFRSQISYMLLVQNITFWHLFL